LKDPLPNIFQKGKRLKQLSSITGMHQTY